MSQASMTALPVFLRLPPFLSAPDTSLPLPLLPPHFSSIPSSQLIVICSSLPPPILLSSRRLHHLNGGGGGGPREGSSALSGNPASVCLPVFPGSRDSRAPDRRRKTIIAGEIKAGKANQARTHQAFHPPPPNSVWSTS